VLAAAVLATSGALTGAEAKRRHARPKTQAAGREAPVKDKALERRLKVTLVYHTHAGDTLTTVAAAVYGHRTWWRRLKKDNRVFAVTVPRTSFAKA